LNTQEQDLLSAFFAGTGGSGKRPRFSQQQLTNQMIHNAQKMRVRQETSKLQEMFLTDPHFKTRLQNSDTDLF